MGASSQNSGISKILIILVSALGCAVFAALVIAVLFPPASENVFVDPDVAEATVRGTIYDETNRILAMDRPVYTLTVDPTGIDDPVSLSRALSGYLTSSESQIYIALITNSSPTTLPGEIFPERLQSLSTFILVNGLSDYTEIKRTFSRIYPAGLHAAQIIGYTDDTNTGVLGLELEYNSYLETRPAFGEDVSYGADLYLTLDLDVQYIADYYISEVLGESEKRAAVLIIDAQSGEIRAEASYPWFDLNRGAQSYARERVNLISTLSLEDSSILQAFRVAIAKELRRGSTLLYYCSGSDLCEGVAHGEITEENALECPSAVALWLSLSDEEDVLTMLAALNLYDASPRTLTGSASLVKTQNIVRPFLVSRLLSHDGQLLGMNSRRGSASPLSAESSALLGNLLSKTSDNSKITFAGNYVIFTYSDDPTATAEISERITATLSGEPISL